MRPSWKTVMPINAKIESDIMCPLFIFRSPKARTSTKPQSRKKMGIIPLITQAFLWWKILPNLTELPAFSIYWEQSVRLKPQKLLIWSRFSCLGGGWVIKGIIPHFKGKRVVFTNFAYTASVFCELCASFAFLAVKIFTAKDAKIYAKYAKKNVRLLPGYGISVSSVAK